MVALTPCCQLPLRQRSLAFTVYFIVQVTNWPGNKPGVGTIGQVTVPLSSFTVNGPVSVWVVLVFVRV